MEYRNTKQGKEVRQVCPFCNQERWVRLVRGKVRSLLCRKCAWHFIGQSNQGRILTNEHKEKIGRASLGHSVSQEARARIGKARIGNQDWLGKHHTDETKEKSRKARIAYLASGGWQNIEPTKLELIVNEILQELLPNEYKFVGNGFTWIAGKCPDFLNVNGQKKLIEVFGDYVHKGQTGEERVSHFRQYGFSTLIIWENELKNREALAERILTFNNS